MSKPIEGVRVKCSRCEQQAVARVRYAKLNLCEQHFAEYLENRVVAFAKRLPIKDVKKALLALSGGKDSLSLAYIISKRKKDLGFESLIGFHLDLGIGDYSRNSRLAVEKLCHEKELTCIVVDLKTLTGYNLPELLLKTKRPPCSLCGLIKRYVINAMSVELGVDATVLGHHLDDILVFALKNLLTVGTLGDVKLTPVARGIPGLLSTRLKLLYEVYEDDLKLYAGLSRVDHTAERCPYKHVDFISASIRDMLENLEKHSPGYKIALIRKLTKQVVEEPPQGLKQCKICGMPSSRDVCAFCNLTAKIMGKPMGPEIRSKLREQAIALHH